MYKESTIVPLILGSFVCLFSSCFSISKEASKPKSSWIELKANHYMDCKDVKYADRAIQTQEAKLTFIEGVEDRLLKFSLLFTDRKLGKNFLLEKSINSLQDITNENGSEKIQEVVDGAEFVHRFYVQSKANRPLDLVLMYKSTQGPDVSFEPSSSSLFLPSNVEAVLAFEYDESSREYLLLTREYIDSEPPLHQDAFVSRDTSLEIEAAVYKVVARKLSFNSSKFEKLFEVEGDQVSFFEKMSGKETQTYTYLFLVDLGKNFDSSKRFKLLKYFSSSKKFDLENIMLKIDSPINDWALVDAGDASKTKQIWLKHGESFSAKSVLTTYKIILDPQLKPILEPVDTMDIRHNSSNLIISSSYSKTKGQGTPVLVQNWLDAESFVKIISHKDSRLKEYDRTGMIEEKWALQQSVFDTSISPNRLWLLFTQIHSRKRVSIRVCMHELSDG